jgi:hypothetical protein
VPAFGSDPSCFGAGRLWLSFSRESLRESPRPEGCRQDRSPSDACRRDSRTEIGGDQNGPGRRDDDQGLTVAVREGGELSEDGRSAVAERVRRLPPHPEVAEGLGILKRALPVLPLGPCRPWLTMAASCILALYRSRDQHGTRQARRSGLRDEVVLWQERLDKGRSADAHLALLAGCREAEETLALVAQQDRAIAS